MLVGIRIWASRSVTVALGLGSIAWGIYAFDVFHAEEAIIEAARSIRAGEIYSPAELDSLREQLDTGLTKLPQSRTLSDVAMVRLRLLEADFAARKFELGASDRTKFDAALTSALAATPSEAFLWLTEYWLQEPGIRASDRGQRLLRMSYLVGPNESWVAAKRNPVALASFGSLSNELAEQALSEFARLVKSGFHQEAAETVAASPPELRKTLVGRLAPLHEGDRRFFANVLRSKNLENVTVPGVDERPNRPF